MKKKLLTVLLIVVIVFNFIFTSVVHADKDDVVPGIERYGGKSTIKGEAVQTMIETGKDSKDNVFSEGNFGEAIGGMIMQYIAVLLNSFPMAVQGVISQIARNPKPGEDDPLKKAVSLTKDLLDYTTYFTIERAVFNEVAMFNINVFDQDTEYTNGIGDKSETIQQAKANLEFKKITAGWYYTCRIIAMMLNLCILMYVGIRMALSTVASEEAKYKKMLIDWAQSMILLFVLHYIMIFAIQLGESVLNIMQVIRYDMYAAGEKGFEDIILSKIYMTLSEKAGMEICLYSIFFWFLTFIQFKFFLAYFKRLFTVMFLTIIAPFITVTYPIDKMDDGKAQAFDAWRKEYIINIAIQPIHAAIYLVFVFTAGKIAGEAPLVAMVFLLALGWMENVVRNIFRVTDTVSMQNVDEGFKK